MDLLFDLDGTLTDPGVGITRCLQHALARLDRETPSTHELTRFVGPPLRATFAELLSTDDAQTVDRAIALYRERFAGIGMFENEIYTGVEEGLRELSAAGHRLWVATSKPQVYATRIVDHFGLLPYFDAVYGSELDGRNSDKVDLIQVILEREDLERSRTWMIGDRAQDVRGGRANGIRTVAVLWGYGSEEELRAERPDLLIGTMAELSVRLRQCDSPFVG